MTAAESRLPAARRFRRILISLDAALDHPDALEAVAVLAARLHADVRGLMVEDDRSLDLAGHPGVRIVSTVTAAGGSIDGRAALRGQRARAAVIREAAARVMAARRVAADFDVRSGRADEVLLSSAHEADLVVLGWGSGGLVPYGRNRPTRPGDIACAVAERSDRPVLVLRADGPRHGPVLVAYDGGEAADRALQSALEIAAGTTETVHVALMTDRLANVAAWRDVLAPRIADAGLAARFVHVPGGDPATLVSATRQTGATLLAIGAEGTRCCGADVRLVLNRAACSVLLVR